MGINAHKSSGRVRGGAGPFGQAVAAFSARCTAARRSAAAYRDESAVRPLKLGRVVRRAFPSTHKVVSALLSVGRDSRALLTSTRNSWGAVRPLSVGIEASLLFDWMVLWTRGHGERHGGHGQGQWLGALGGALTPARAAQRCSQLGQAGEAVEASNRCQLGMPTYSSAHSHGAQQAAWETQGHCWR